MAELDDSLDTLAQQQRTPPRGLPPPQPTPPGVATAMQHQQQWAMPGIESQLSDIAAKFPQAIGNYLQSINQSAREATTGMEGDLEWDSSNPDHLTTQVTGALNILPHFVGWGALGAERAAVGVLGGKLFHELLPEERSLWGQWLQKPEHLNEYLGNMHNPNTMKYVADIGKEGQINLAIGGPIYNNYGQKVGNISRYIYPKDKSAYHGSINVDQDVQGAGIAKALSLAHKNIYQKTGINQSKVTAAEKGSSLWAHLGYKPDAPSWDSMKDYIRYRSRSLGRDMPPQAQMEMERLLHSYNPEAMWGIADIGGRAPNGQTIGQYLLEHGSWTGRMDYTDPVSVLRMDTNAKR